MHLIIRLPCFGPLAIARFRISACYGFCCLLMVPVTMTDDRLHGISQRSIPARFTHRSRLFGPCCLQPAYPQCTLYIRFLFVRLRFHPPIMQPLGAAFGFVSNYAYRRLLPQTDGMPVILQPPSARLNQERRGLFIQPLIYSQHPPVSGKSCLLPADEYFHLKL